MHVGNHPCLKCIRRIGHSCQPVIKLLHILNGPCGKTGSPVSSSGYAVIGKTHGKMCISIMGSLAEIRIVERLIQVAHFLARIITGCKISVVEKLSHSRIIQPGCRDCGTHSRCTRPVRRYAVHAVLDTVRVIKGRPEKILRRLGVALRTVGDTAGSAVDHDLFCIRSCFRCSCKQAEAHICSCGCSKGCQCFLSSGPCFLEFRISCISCLCTAVSCRSTAISCKSTAVSYRSTAVYCSGGNRTIMGCAGCIFRILLIILVYRNLTFPVFHEIICIIRAAPHIGLRIIR